MRRTRFLILIASLVLAVFLHVDAVYAQSDASMTGRDGRQQWGGAARGHHHSGECEHGPE